VDQIHHSTKVVEVTPARAGSPPVFLGDKGEVATIVVQEMRRVLADPDGVPYLDSKAVALLQAAKQSARNAGLLERQVHQHTGGLTWFPWVGTRCLRTLELFARSNQINCAADDLALTYPGLSPDTLKTHLQQIASGQEDPVRLAGFMQPKQFEKFDEYLDSQILDRVNANDRLDVQGAQQSAAIALNELDSLKTLEQPL
jgi:ATP-dependent helicase Lhr and Lhr-like helicase